MPNYPKVKIKSSKQIHKEIENKICNLSQEVTNQQCDILVVVRDCLTNEVYVSYDPCDLSDNFLEDIAQQIISQLDT